MSDAAGSLLQRNIAEHLAVVQAVAAWEDAITQAGALIVRCLRQGGKLLICGNGGSATDAAHLAAEFVVRYQKDRPPYPAIALAESGAILTAMGNDYAIEQAFARQVAAFAQPHDVLIVLSTSGNSRNIVLALEEARRRNLASIALLGRDGGKCRDLATTQIIVPSTCTARIQEAHLLIYHTLCEMVEKDL